MANEPSVQEALARLQSGASFAEAIGLSEETVAHIEQLAAALYSEDRLDEARTLFQGLVSLFPDRAEYWSALGAVLTRMEHHEEAVPVLSVALHLNPEDTSALVNRGECFIALGQVEDAARDLERAIELDPGETDPASHRARQLAYGLYMFFDTIREAGLDTVDIEEDEPW